MGYPQRGLYEGSLTGLPPEGPLYGFPPSGPRRVPLQGFPSSCSPLGFLFQEVSSWLSLTRSPIQGSQPGEPSSVSPRWSTPEVPTMVFPMGLHSRFYPPGGHRQRVHTRGSHPGASLQCSTGVTLQRVPHQWFPSRHSPPGFPLSWVSSRFLHQGYPTRRSHSECPAWGSLQRFPTT